MAIEMDFCVCGNVFKSWLGYEWCRFRASTRVRTVSTNNEATPLIRRFKGFNSDIALLLLEQTDESIP
ncbi:Uncharacterised protein [Cedecea davisae]|uniref:Uncharacterized protein n=1 Tax=Cedecea davisae DSM 4568 TaxID=566551 RepID=S3J6X2_9ENTR|nr:hypothetical protein HMPREF0201_02977 [Cedecea davisae DSM 4568]SUX38634.1 Uncharacterised protein [Cedecea davisae]